MVSFELAKEAEKDVFRLVSSVGQRKNSESWVWARFLHTSRMNNVDSVMFVGQIIDQITLSNCYFAYTFYSVEVITTKLMK